MQIVSVCARITPPQKLRTVQARKAAHVSVTMGRHGNGVAREAANLSVPGLRTT